MTNYILGIDPGQSGGFAILDESGDLIDAIVAPLSYPSKKPTLDYMALSTWIREIDAPQFLGPSQVFLEAVHSMPGQGIASAFQFGRIFGAAELFAQAVCADVRYITPQKWKAHFGLLKSEKRASVDMATERFGTDEHWPAGPRGGAGADGPAEAALIALYGIHTMEITL